MASHVMAVVGWFLEASFVHEQRCTTGLFLPFGVVIQHSSVRNEALPKVAGSLGSLYPAQTGDDRG